MFNPTSNLYRFRYLITGISGPGIEHVHLPEQPSDSKIHYKKEQKFIAPQPSEQLSKWMKEALVARLKNPEYLHAHQKEINAWEDQEFERSRPNASGFWFWNNGVATWITPFYYWVLTTWNPYFGKPTYRETDKEITYWILFWEDDPDSFGGALNTIRRYGKSSIMGAWIVWRTTKNFNHTSGMQGETDKKIAAFYRKMILKPFYKLRSYHQPTYNMDSKQATKIEFDIPPKRSVKRTQESEEQTVLESVIDYRPSGEGEYDGEILHSYIMEEPGKLQKVSLYDEEGEGRWDIIKPCFLQGGEEIIGKCLMGTTVENLKVVDRGGQAYMRLFYDSDYNKREEDGRTMSGLYAAFLPGDCALKGYMDEWGHPKRDEARAYLLKVRKSYKNRPSKLAGWIRKYPIYLQEIFYVNPDGCEFNVQVLNERETEIMSSAVPLVDRIDFDWQNKKRDTKVIWRHNPDNGWCQVARGVGFADMPNNLIEEVGYNPETGVKLWRPKNLKLAAGCDPIQHGVVVQVGRASKPVVLVKSKYDPALDGPYPDQETLEKNAENKHPYLSNRYILMFDKRPTDPNKFFEYALMICVYFGIPLHVESQKNAIISYFHARGYGEFILLKYRPEFAKPDSKPIEGTPASQPLIQEYTSKVATWIEYFGHTMPFLEVIKDNKVFKPLETKVHDYTVSQGMTELACDMKPKVQSQPVEEITHFMPKYDRFGNIVN